MPEPVSGDTLIIFVTDSETKLFLTNWHETACYEVCDGKILNVTDTTSDVDNHIEHLAYMLGIEPYYGTAIPPLVKGRAVTNHDDGWQSGRPDNRPAVAPWAYRLVDPGTTLVNFRKVVRVIRTGWFG